MRLLLVNSFYAPDEIGGAERSVRFLAENLAAEGNEVSVVCCGRGRSTETISGVKVERLGVANMYHPLDASTKNSAQKAIWHMLDSYNLWMKKRVLEIVESFKPDVLHTNTLSGISVGAWGAGKAIGVPIVHTLRDYYLLCPNAAMFSAGRQCEGQCFKCRAYSSVRKAKSSDVDVVVGNSAFILNYHLAAGYFPNANRHVVFNAYQPKEFKHVDRDDGVLRFGFIGRIAPAKGVDFLIKAFRTVSGRGGRVELIIAGDGDSEYLSYLASLADGMNVKFVGRVEPEQFYEQIDWTVVPSLWNEPLARVIFESFSHGVPVIASRTGGSAELVVDGETGVLFDPDSPERLSTIMSEVTWGEDGYQKYREKVLCVSKKFRPENVLREYMDVYKSVVR